MSDAVRAPRRLRGVTAAVVLIVADIVLSKMLLPQYLDDLRMLSQTDPDGLRAEYERALPQMFGRMGVLGALIGLHTLRLGLRTRRALQFAGARIIRGALFAFAAVGSAVGLHVTIRDMLGPALPAPMPAPPDERSQA